MTAGAVAGKSVLQSEVLEDLAVAANYRRWLASLAIPYLGDDPLEIGSGGGQYATEWLDHACRFTVSEADGSRLAVLRRRFARHNDVRVQQILLPGEHDGRHSAVVAYNVLEHIADDVAALRGCARLVRAGGNVVLLVPAFNVAMSEFDREIGHFRRYRVGTLRAAVETAGLELDSIRYVNPLGLLAWIAGMRLLRLRPGDGPALTFWDRAVVPVARWLEGDRRPPFGQSVFAVARRPTA